MENFSIMIPSFVLGLREGLEAALIIGIVLAALRQTGRTELNKTVWIGVGLAIILSISAAIGLFAAGAEFKGQAEVIFEGSTLLLAVLLLTWMLFWMKRQSSELKANIAEKVSGQKSVARTSPLMWLVFFAVLREGVELAIFLLAASFTSDEKTTLLGAILGLFGAVAAGWLLNITSRKISLRKFFQYTNLLLIFFAAGLFAHGIHEFAEIGWLPTGLDPLYNISTFLSSDSIAGSIMKALFGYNPTPMFIEALAYTAYLAALLFLTLFPGRKTALTENK
jgi:high-affinity iron transporter